MPCFLCSTWKESKDRMISLLKWLSIGTTFYPSWNISSMFCSWLIKDWCKVNDFALRFICSLVQPWKLNCHVLEKLLKKNYKESCRTTNWFLSSCPFLYFCCIYELHACEFVPADATNKFCLDCFICKLIVCASNLLDNFLVVSTVLQSVEEAECQRAYDLATNVYMSSFDRSKPPEEVSFVAFSRLVGLNAFWLLGDCRLL